MYYVMLLSVVATDAGRPHFIIWCGKDRPLSPRSVPLQRYRRLLKIAAYLGTSGMTLWRRSGQILLKANRHKIQKTSPFNRPTVGLRVSCLIVSSVGEGRSWCAFGGNYSSRRVCSGFGQGQGVSNVKQSSTS